MPKKMFPTVNPQNQGFSPKQIKELSTLMNRQKKELKSELREDLKEQMSDYFVKAFKEVMQPYMEVQQEKWDENKQEHMAMRQQLQHMERVMNAHTVELHDMNQKLSVFIDRSVQHDGKLDDHETKRSNQLSVYSYQ